MASKRKTLTMQVTVSVPAWMTAADARREVRTLINEQCNYLGGHFVFDLNGGSTYREVHDKTVRARKVRPATKSV